MDPTLSSGKFSYTNVFDRNPDIGDIVQFYCPNEKCGRFPLVVHRVTDINQDGCYWILGDNRENAYDSGDYGWLCPHKDIWITGTVYPLSWINTRLNR